MARIRIRCQKCGKVEIYEPDAEDLRRAEEIGLTPISFHHGDHVLVVYFDRNLHIRRTTIYKSVEEERARPSVSVTGALLKVRVPTIVNPSAIEEAGLTEDERAVLSLIDGRRSISEIAMASGLSDGEVLNILMKLEKLGIVRVGRRRVGA